jgi:hypothetical protein
MTAPIPHRDHDSRITRRGIFIGAAVSLVCAPAIVRATSLMPIRRSLFPVGPQHAGYCERLYFHTLEGDLRSGKMSTNLNGEIVSESSARRTVAHARAHGFLPSYV